MNPISRREAFCRPAYQRRTLKLSQLSANVAPARAKLLAQGRFGNSASATTRSCRPNASSRRASMRSDTNVSSRARETPTILVSSQAIPIAAQCDARIGGGQDACPARHRQRSKWLSRAGKLHPLTSSRRKYAKLARGSLLSRVTKGLCQRPWSRLARAQPPRCALERGVSISWGRLGAGRIVVAQSKTCTLGTGSSGREREQAGMFSKELGSTA